MALSTSAAAKAACELRGWNVSNLEIQKILYIAHMIHLGEHGVPLVNEIFQAWDYGPVLPSLYRALAMFGAEPVKDVFYRTGSSEGTPERATMDRVVPFLARLTPGQLIDVTHWPHGAWAKVYRPGVRGIPIPNSLVKHEYSARAQRNTVRPAAA